MKNLLIILLICTFSSCFLWKPSAEKVRKQAVKDSIAADKACMDSLKAFVAKNWTYNENGYQPTDKFSEFFGQKCVYVKGADTPQEYIECLRNLSMKQAEYIFGKPSERGEKSMKYYLSIPYYDDNFRIDKSRKHYMNLTFDTPDKTLRCIFIW